MPRAVEAGWFAVQERVIWPLQDRFALLDDSGRRAVVGGGAFALLAVAVFAVLALPSSGGSSSPTTTVSEVAAPTQSTPARPPKPQPQKHTAPRETLHGAAPVFSPPSPASKGGERTGASNSKTADHQTTSTSPAEAAPDASAASAASSGKAAGEATSTNSSPASATISSDPSNRAASDSGKTAPNAATDARAAIPNGPPAGPAALKVAREFAQGFVVYETGGANSEAFRDAFDATATPELAKALLQRPPKQPTGVKVPRAKVLNVVAGPSQGTVYGVSVALLRVDVTSELRLQMEKLKTGRRAEWRVTNVLG
ncbi:MAG TPA: hypothetical protein VGG40_09130 [Solirubrobacterales bacterium]